MTMMRSTRTANDTFKHSYRTTLAFGLIGAVAVHFALFSLFPKMHANRLAAAEGELKAIELPPEVQIPPPPEQIARPATPRVAAAEIDEDVTIAPTTFESNPAENLAPPPPSTNPADRPSFIPYTQAPELQNRAEVLTFLRRTYPTILRQAGIGGTVLLWLYIDEAGQVQRTVLAESSGYEELDSVAQQVAEKMVFSPAFNRDKKTAVWLSQSIDFDVG
jgi:TonB family protein